MCEAHSQNAPDDIPQRDSDVVTPEENKNKRENPIRKLIEQSRNENRAWEHESKRPLHDIGAGESICAKHIFRMRPTYTTERQRCGDTRAEEKQERKDKKENKQKITPETCEKFPG